jgi:inhibitor of KinA sporulation pathway (predicted exonuclease)
VAKKLDAILVVDLEATCWQGEPPPGETSEIIEIGLCLLDAATGERSEPRSLMIKPERSTLSAFCVQLTTITAEMLADGLSFTEACTILKEEYQSDKRTWASYGDYDRLAFMQQCEETATPYPFGRTHINVKNLLALQYQLKSEVDLLSGMNLVGLPFEGTIHRGGDDAWNIAAVLNRVLYGGHR